MIFNFAQLDPRPIPAAQAANDKVFEDAPKGVLGIEVTVPALADRCSLGNIDPQHGEGGDATIAAIQAALELPDRKLQAMEGRATLATVRPDLDSVGAMAVLQLRTELEANGDNLPVPAHSFDGQMARRIRLIAESDTFANGPWTGPRSLPSQEDPWPNGRERELTAMAAAVGDFKVPLEERVALMRRWLLTGDEPVEYRRLVEDERAELVRALEDREIQVDLTADDRIAVVRSKHRAALAVGYACAPVVIAENPEFQLGGGDPHCKLTIAAYSEEYAAIKGALTELTEREPGWGGSPTIGGSPQGVSSTLSVEEVAEVLARHLK